MDKQRIIRVPAPLKNIYHIDFHINLLINLFLYQIVRDNFLNEHQVDQLASFF